jgi:anti-sigma regulatory factor (Ser/Thr protein kinase)
LPGTGKVVARHSARFPAAAESLPKLHVAFESFFEAAQAAACPVRRADRVPLVTAAGEIAANIIEHACAGLPDGWIQMDLVRHSHDVEVLFEDPGIPYVPVDKPVDPIPQGGMGLLVAGASLHALEYTRDGSVNRWRLYRQTGLVAPEDGGPPVVADRTKRMLT